LSAAWLADGSGVLPNADSALLLLCGLVASGQLKFRKLDGYQEFDQVGQAAA
jgi:hypothetical protein